MKEGSVHFFFWVSGIRTPDVSCIGLANWAKLRRRIFFIFYDCAQVPKSYLTKFLKRNWGNMFTYVVIGFNELISFHICTFLLDLFSHLSNTFFISFNPYFSHLKHPHNFHSRPHLLTDNISWGMWWKLKTTAFHFHCHFLRHSISLFESLCLYFFSDCNSYWCS